MEFALLKLQVVYYIKQVCNFLWLKCGPAIVFAALMPHSIALQGLCVLFGLDFFCGIWLAKKTHTLSSSGMRRGLSKMLIYFIFISAIALAEQTMLDTSGITLVAIGLLAMTEVLSITENLVMLGMPIPFAAKILSLLSNKVGNYGINIGQDADSFASLKDMVDMMEEIIPTYKKPELRTILSVYVSYWYSFARDLDEASLSGPADLVRARLRNSLARVLVDVRSALAREAIAVDLQDLFINQWNKGFYARLLVQVDAKIDDTVSTTEDRIDAIRESIALMLYRLIKATAPLDDAETLTGTTIDDPA